MSWTYLVEDVEVLKHGIPSRRNRAIVWIVDRVVEVTQLGPDRFVGHGDGLQRRPLNAE